MSKKENKTVKKSIVTLTLTVFILVLFIGLTISKYITLGTKSGSMQVAKWNVTITEGDLDNKKYTPQTIVADRIAPGTEGTFGIKVDATGTEVGVRYDVEFTDIQNKPTNMYFMVGTTRYNTFDDLATGISDTINADDSNKVREVTVKWVWDYETGNDEATKTSNNVIDTQEGIAGQTMTFNANVTAEQVQPTE